MFAPTSIPVFCIDSSSSILDHLLPRRTYISRHHRRLCSLGASSSPLCPLNDSRPRCCRCASTWLCRILSSSFPHHGSVLFLPPSTIISSHLRLPTTTGAIHDRERRACTLPRGRDHDSEGDVCVSERLCERECVCVCVCEREREREREMCSMRTMRECV